MSICVDIEPLAKPQRPQRYSVCGRLARARNRTRTARNHGPNSTFSYSFANKLTNITSGSAIPNHRYAYDRAGNLTNLLSTTATNRFFYNAHNKLVRIEGRGFTNEFLYDSQNRRISVKLSGTWRYDVHDGNLCIGSVVNGFLDRFFVRGAGIVEGTGDIVAEIPDPRNPSPHPYYYISNHRGDTLTVLDYLYNTAARYEYDAFGNVIDKTGTYTPTYTFSTKEFLPKANLYLYQYRVYDPIAGRWTQRDPIDYQDSINLYQFCGNNPMNAWDSDGRVTVQISVSLFAGAGLGLNVNLGVAVSFGKEGFAISRFTTEAGGAVAGASASASFELAVSRNEHISDLAGPTWEVGGSGGAAVSIGGAYNLPLSGRHKGDPRYGIASVSVGFGPPGAEGHSFVTTTQIHGHGGGQETVPDNTREDKPKQ